MTGPVTPGVHAVAPPLAALPPPAPLPLPPVPAPPVPDEGDEQAPLAASQQVPFVHTSPAPHAFPESHGQLNAPSTQKPTGPVELPAIPAAFAVPPLPAPLPLAPLVPPVAAVELPAAPEVPLAPTVPEEPPAAPPLVPPVAPPPGAPDWVDDPLPEQAPDASTSTTAQTRRSIRILPFRDAYILLPCRSLQLRFDEKEINSVPNVGGGVCRKF